MWLKKSPAELKDEQQARRLTTALCVLGVSSLVVVCWLPYASLNLPTRDRVLVVLVAFLLLLGWLRHAHKRHLHTNVWVCEQCNRVKSIDRNDSCTCQGRYASLCYMKWL